MQEEKKSEQNKFFHLLFDSNKTSLERFDSTKIDVPDLIAILQCFGFVLHKFEKSRESANLNNQEAISAQEISLNMEIECSASGMKANLVKVISGCKCPSTDATSEAEFWNISGCGPSNQGNISRSMSSLVPSVTSYQAKYINLLLVKALDLINNADINQNESHIVESFKKGNLSSLSRHRSLDTIKTTDDINTAQLPVWDALSNVPSPKQTSSPIPDLCNSLKQISLGSQSVTRLTDILKEMQKLISESIEITVKCQNTTFIKPEDIETRRLSDIKISPLAVEGENKPLTGSFINIQKIKTPNSSGHKKTPQNRVFKVCVSTGEVKYLGASSKLAPLNTKRYLNATPTTSKSTVTRIDTPRPDVSQTSNSSSLLKSKPLKLSDVKAKICTRMEGKLTSKLRTPQKVVASSASKKK